MKKRLCISKVILFFFIQLECWQLGIAPPFFAGQCASRALVKSMPITFFAGGPPP
jgi:hypothetical protein